MENVIDLENGLLIISKQTIDVLLKQKKAADLIALYTFYYYTAKWQKTNQPKAVISYCAKGLHWKESKVRATKKILVDLKLIEDVKRINPVSKKVEGWYIKIHYFGLKSTLPQNPQGGLIHRVDSGTPNALDNNINALDNNRRNAWGTSSEKSAFKGKPTYRGMQMRWSQNRWWVLPPDGGEWLEFADKESSINWVK